MMEIFCLVNCTHFVKSFFLKLKMKLKMTSQSFPTCSRCSRILRYWWQLFKFEVAGKTLHTSKVLNGKNFLETQLSIVSLNKLDFDKFTYVISWLILRFVIAINLKRNQNRWVRKWGLRWKKKNKLQWNTRRFSSFFHSTRDKRKKVFQFFLTIFVFFSSNDEPKVWSRCQYQNCGK